MPKALSFVAAALLLSAPLLAAPAPGVPRCNAAALLQLIESPAPPKAVEALPLPIELAGLRDQAVKGGPCVNGDRRTTPLTGCCCNFLGESRGRVQVEQCVNGAWVVRGVACEGDLCAEICPH